MRKGRSPTSKGSELQGKRDLEAGKNGDLNVIIDQEKKRKSLPSEVSGDFRRVSHFTWS